jgi:hypothetical protein
MADFPSLRGSSGRVQDTLLGTTTQLLTVTANGSNNTKGSYTEIVTTTSFECCGFILTFEQGSLLGDCLLDIAIGAGGSEQDVLSNILLSAQISVRLGSSQFIPLAIPANTRISARCQTSTGGQAVYCGIYPVARDLKATPGFHRAVTYGASTADSGGTSIDPGGSANTKGAYSQLSASLTIPVSFLLLMPGSAANGTPTNARWNVDIAIGAGGSEEVIVPDLHFALHTTTKTIFPFIIGLPVNIPAGQRLSARAQCDITDATDRLMDLVAIGLN